MSYSASKSGLSKDDAVAEVLGAIGDQIETLSNPPDGMQDAMREHGDRISGALSGLLEVVGRDGDQVNVTVSGHANPGHAPTPGWADETVTITITQVPAPVDPTA